LTFDPGRDYLIGMENKPHKYYFSVSYSVYRGNSERAYVWSCRHDRIEENGPEHFIKLFSSESEKEAEKEANAYAKAHNKAIRERQSKAKAELLAAKEAKKAGRVAKKQAVEIRIQGFINPKIKEIIAILFEKQKANVLESLTKQYEHVVKLLKGIEGLNRQDEKYKKLMEDRRWGPSFANQVANRIMEHKKNADAKYEGTWSPDYPIFFKAANKKIVEQMIQDDLESIMLSFLTKMEYKLGEVIKGKEIEEFTSEGLHDGFVRFTFKDGTGFLLSNSIEWGTSKNGVSFQRFPCRFHNVNFGILRDAVKWVSEEEMKKDF
jgi:hypothetical protein